MTRKYIIVTVVLNFRSECGSQSAMSTGPSVLIVDTLQDRYSKLIDQRKKL